LHEEVLSKVGLKSGKVKVWASKNKTLRSLKFVTRSLMVKASLVHLCQKLSDLSVKIFLAFILKYSLTPQKKILPPNIRSSPNSHT